MPLSGLLLLGRLPTLLILGCDVVVGRDNDRGYGIVVRQAWRAWALCQHVATGRRDVDAIDCFGPSRRYFQSIDWDAMRKWAYSNPCARTVACGAMWSPVALGGRMAVRPATSCIWHPCEELGTWEHVAWLCPCRPAGSYCPRHRLALSARWGWVVKGQQVGYVALHRWLITVQEKL